MEQGLQKLERSGPTEERMRLALIRIAELNGPIECTSLREWHDKVQKIALAALNGRTS